MSETIWVDVKGRGKEEVPRDNSMMLRLADQLDRVSDKLGVARLTQFYDHSELETQYADFAEEEALTPPAENADDQQSKGIWFDAAPALTAARAIYDHLTRYPEDLDFAPEKSRSHWPASLMEELKHCQSTLEAAASRGHQFRFLIVP